ARATLGPQQVRPALRLKAHAPGVRVVDGAAVGLDALAGVEEQEAVEALEGLLAVARHHLVQRLAEYRRLVAGARPLGVVAPLLADLDPVEDLALDVEGARGLLKEVVVQAAVDRLAGGVHLLEVAVAAEEGVLPLR